MKKSILLIALVLFLGSILFSCVRENSPATNDTEETTTITVQTTIQLEVPPLAELTAEYAKTIIVEGQELADRVAFLFIEGALDFYNERIIDGHEGYFPVLPSTGFSSVADVRNALLQYYTEEMVGRLMTGDDGRGTNFPNYVDYGGRLYFKATIGYPTRFNWEEATYTLLESGDSFDILEVEVTELDCVLINIFHVTFMDGRIHQMEWILI